VGLLIVWSLVGLALWGGLLRTAPAGAFGRVHARSWRVGDAIFAGVLAAFLLFLFIASGDGNGKITPDAVNGTMLFDLMLLSVVLGTVASSGIPLREVFGLAPTRPLRALGVAVLCLAATYPLFLLAGEIAQLLGHPVGDDAETVKYLAGPLKPWDKAAAILLAVGVAPLVEEFIYRGFFYGVTKKFAGPWAAMISSALVFAAIHQNPPALPAYFLLACGLTLAYERTGSIWTPIAMHVLFNAITVVVIFFFPQWIH
jgi:membrane protease YdiL (CAAX protease family)